MPENDERLKILDDLEHGRITAQEGLRKLQALEAVSGPGTEDEEGVPRVFDLSLGDEALNRGAGPEPSSGHASLPLPSDMRRVQSLFWQVPFWGGAALTVLGALLLYRALQSSGLGLLFFLAGFPVALGVVLIAIGWWARAARWLHLRIQNRPGRRLENLAISFPLPLGLASWILQRYGGRIFAGRGAQWSEMLRTFRETTTPDRPFYAEANDEKTGEKVRIYIG